MARRLDNQSTLFSLFYIRMRRMKVRGRSAVYHCMTRTVNGEGLFKRHEKEVLRKMIWQVADFCGVEVLTYCIMGNHFHVFVWVPDRPVVSDSELMRRYRVLYPKPTKYQAESSRIMESQLLAGGDDAVGMRRKLLARMSDVSEFMKTLKQRFSVWYNRSHRRYGTLWAERFKSVLVEGQGNSLQTIGAYIDLNPVRAGIVEDPKDYRFCGYAEAVVGNAMAQQGLCTIWADYMGRVAMRITPQKQALEAHRMLIFGKGSSPWTHKGQLIDCEKALKVLEKEHGTLSRAVVLRCRVRYFTDGAVFGSAEFVHRFAQNRLAECGRKSPPKVNALRGADWGDLSVLRGLRRRIFT